MCPSTFLAISLLSIHLHEARHYRGENLGLAYQCNSWEVGAYKNSISRHSAFMGKRFSHLELGLVSGYRKYPVPFILAYQDLGPIEIVAIPLVEKAHTSPTGVVLSLRWRFSLTKGVEK